MENPFDRVAAIGGPEIARLLACAARAAHTSDEILAICRGFDAARGVRGGHHGSWYFGSILGPLSWADANAAAWEYLESLARSKGDSRDAATVRV